MAVRKYSLDEILEELYRSFGGEKIEIMSPQVRGKKGEFKNLFSRNREQGFMRVRVDGSIMWLEEDIPLDKNKKHHIEVVVDRLKALPERKNRIAEAVETALLLSDGYVLICGESKERVLTENYVCPDCGIALPEVEPRLFSFNSPYGACSDCSGLGSHQYFSEESAVDPHRSVLEGALLPWKKQHYMINKLQRFADHNNWDLAKPFDQLSRDEKDFILYGSDQRIPLEFKDRSNIRTYMGRYEGLLIWLENRWRETDSDNVLDELSKYRVEDRCQKCNGLRLKPEALMVKVGRFTLGDLVEIPVHDLTEIVEKISLTSKEQSIVGQVLVELRKRLSFLTDVGVGYLSLNRRADTLSGGESQRIRLATQIGSKLTGVMYVLDEPTIGLHPRDTDRLLKTLLSIRDLGNTVIVVEHDRDTMSHADFIIEMGPEAGERGGEIVQSGNPAELKAERSLTIPFLKGLSSGITKAPVTPRTPESWINVKGASHNNLKNLDISIPLGVITCISGVSGSGKSTLAHEVLYKGLKRYLDSDFRERPGKFEVIEGWRSLKNVVLVDQSPIGRTPRSNPATYTGVFTRIRELFSKLPESRMRGYTPGRFSFNIKGGRCEACGGGGSVKVSMLFLPDVYVKCEVCDGKRYNSETLEVQYKGKTISEVLEMTVDEAKAFFQDVPQIASKLALLQDAGLGYIKLGQSALTLSGGEAQRVKLAKELSKRFSGHTLYILDEPTTGLFYTDIRKLLKILHKIVNKGNSVLLIEHNLDVLVSADYIIDLGPEGGDKGGRVVFHGTPDQLSRSRKGYTSSSLREYIKENTRKER